MPWIFYALNPDERGFDIKCSHKKPVIVQSCCQFFIETYECTSYILTLLIAGRRYMMSYA